MKTPFISILFFIIASVLGALGQFLYKSGIERINQGVATYYKNFRLLTGVVCYIAVMFLFMAAFKKGGSLTVLYPIYASTFIWAAIIAYYAFGVPIKPINIIGMVTLIVGMFLMGI